MDIIWPGVLMYVGSMMFGWIIAKVFQSGLVVELEVSLHFSSNNQKYLISIACDLCCLIVLLTIPTVVVLSMCIGVGGCGWLSSARISHNTLASCVFRKSAPSSASAAEAATSLRIAHVI